VGVFAVLYIRPTEQTRPSKFAKFNPSYNLYDKRIFPAIYSTQSAYIMKIRQFSRLH